MTLNNIDVSWTRQILKENQQVHLLWTRFGVETAIGVCQLSCVENMFLELIILHTKPFNNKMVLRKMVFGMVDKFNNKSLTHGCYNYIKFTCGNGFFFHCLPFCKKKSEKRIFRHKVPKKNHHKTFKNLKICQESQLPATWKGA